MCTMPRWPNVAMTAKDSTLANVQVATRAAIAKPRSTSCSPSHLATSTARVACAGTLVASNALRAGPPATSRRAKASTAASAAARRDARARARPRSQGDPFAVGRRRRPNARGNSRRVATRGTHKRPLRKKCKHVFALCTRKKHKHLTTFSRRPTRRRRP